MFGKWTKIIIEEFVCIKKDIAYVCVCTNLPSKYQTRTAILCPFITLFVVRFGNGVRFSIRFLLYVLGTGYVFQYAFQLNFYNLTLMAERTQNIFLNIENHQSVILKYPYRTKYVRYKKTWNLCKTPETIIISVCVCGFQVYCVH